MRKILHVAVHHTGSKWGCAEEIIHWHTDPKPKGNGWSRPGYHYMINNGYPTYRSYYRKVKVKGWDGKIEDSTDGLVPEKHTSNGVLAFNSNLINVCLVGNFDQAYPSDAQINSLDLLCEKLLKKYNLDYTAIIGHHEAIALREAQDGKIRKDHHKTCPGTAFGMPQYRKQFALEMRKKNDFYFDNE